MSEAAQNTHAIRSAALLLVAWFGVGVPACGGATGTLAADAGVMRDSGEVARDALDAQTGPPRPFHLGFMGGSATFIRDNADLIVHHTMDGEVPWAEAAQALPFAQYPKALQAEWVANRDRYPTHNRFGQPIMSMVDISPLDSERLGIARAWGATDSGQAPANWTQNWQNQPLDSQQVIDAYYNYAKTVVEIFHPRDLNLGIETNLLLNKTVQQDPSLKRWNQYKALHRAVYVRLKRDHPNLRIFISIQYQTFQGDWARQERELRSLADANDVIALSSYPYSPSGPMGFCPAVPAGSPTEYNVSCSLPGADYYATAVTFAAGKPVGIAETAFPSRNFTWTNSGNTYHFTFSEAQQAQYIANVLEAAQANRFEFVTSSFTADIINLLDKFPDPAIRAIFMLFAYNGLTDSMGRPKPSLAVWNSYLARPYSR